MVKHLAIRALPCICYITLALQSFAASAGGSASEKDIRFSFSAPAGWRLHSTYRKHVYYLYQASRGKHPNCPVGVSSQIANENLTVVQDAAIARVRRIYSGPSPPVVRRQELQSLGGVRILKAEARFDTYLQPGLKRGKGSCVRCIIYTCRGDSAGRIYNLVCYPQLPQGAFYDKALDDMARSVTF